MFVRKREVLRIDWPWMDFKTGWPMATVISQGSFILWSAAWLAVQQRRLAADSRDQFLPKVDSCRKLNLVNWCQADVIYEEEQVQEGERDHDQNINEWNIFFALAWLSDWNAASKNEEINVSHTLPVHVCLMYLNVFVHSWIIRSMFKIRCLPEKLPTQGWSCGSGLRYACILGVNAYARVALLFERFWLSCIILKMQLQLQLWWWWWWSSLLMLLFVAVAFAVLHIRVIIIKSAHDGQFCLCWWVHARGQTRQNIRTECEKM